MFSSLDNISTVPESAIEDRFKDRSVTGDLFYNMNTTYAGIKNRADEKLKDFEGAGTLFNVKDKDAQEYLLNMNPSVRERIDWTEVNSWEQLEVMENRIKYSDEGMAHLQEDLGTVGTVVAGLPVALLDPVDALALGPLGWAYKATKTTNKIIKNTFFGGAYGLASESLYQSEMGLDDPDAKVLSTVFGATLMGGASALKSSVRGIHSVTKDTNADGAEVEKVLSNEELAEIKVQNGQKVVDRLVDDEADLGDQLNFWKGEVAKNKEFYGKSSKEFKASVKEYDNAVARYDVLTTEIAKQKEIAKFKDAKAKYDYNITEAKTFNTNRTTVLKQTKEAVKEQTALRKLQVSTQKVADELAEVRAELETRINNKQPTARVVKKLNKLEAEYKKLKPETKPGTRNINRQLRDLAKIISDNNTILKNSNRAKLDIGRRLTENEASVTKLAENSKFGNLNKLKQRDIAELEKELNGLDVTGKAKKAKDATKKYQMFERILSEKMENFGRVKDGKKAVKKQIVEERSMLQTLEKELEDVTKAKNDLETLANEGEGILKKVGNFIPYITPKSLLHASNNAVVRGIGQRLYAPVRALQDEAGNLIPSSPDAKSFKNRYEANWTASLHELYNGYRQAVNEGYKGREADYFDEVTKGYIKANDNARKMAEDLGKDSVVSPTYKHENKHIEKAMNDTAAYFKTMGDIGKGLKVEGFKSIEPGAYLPRVFDYNKINKLGKTKAVNVLAEAILKKNPQRDPIEARNQAFRIIDNIEESNYMAQLVKDGYGKSADSSRQLMKTLDVYDSDIQDIIGTNVLELGSAYSYSMSGRFSLQKMFGITKAEDINELLNEMTKAGATPKERDSAEVLVNTILGTRELMSNPNSFYGKTLRMLTKGNFTVYSMGFGITSMVEVANIIGTTGLKPVLNTHFDAISNIRNDLTGNPASKKWINELRGIGLVGDAINSRAIQRYDSVDTINSNGLIEQTLDKWNNSLSKYSGLIPLTDALKTLAMGSGYSWLLQTAKLGNLSKADMNRIYRMGLTEDDLAMLKDIDGKFVEYEADGSLKAFNFDKWDADFGQKVQDAMMRHTESTVLHPDGASLPMWMSDPNSPVARIMFQFMRFPIAAYEQLSLRGMTEFDAKQTMGIASNLALFTLLAQIKDFGDPTPRYDLNTEEGQKNLMMYMMTNNYGIGPILTMMERAYTLGTGHQPFSTWNQGSSAMLGISGTTLKNGQEAASGLVEGDVQKVIKNTAELTPLNSMFFIKHNLEPLIEGATDVD